MHVFLCGGFSGETQFSTWSAKARDRGVGIVSLQERTRQIGGCLDIEFSNAGTTARVVIPA